MKPKEIEPFEIISFGDTCRLLESENFFIMIFKGTDDLNDTYASILLDNPDIAKGLGSRLIICLNSRSNYTPTFQ